MAEKSSSLYPDVIQTNPEATAYSSQSSSSSSALYPKIDVNDMAENLFPEENDAVASENPSAVAALSAEEVMVRIPGAIVHLIEKDNSVELAAGDLSVVGLRQGENIVAVLARVGEDQIQWPLARDEAAVKLDASHYFFALRVPADSGEDGRFETLNYGLTIASKGQESKIAELDRILERFSAFSVENVEGKGVLDGAVARETSPEEMESEEETRELVRVSSAAYWTTVAPNVEDYSGSAAKLIAAGSGQLIRGILWCGDVTVDRLKWGDEFLRKRMSKSYNKEISPETLRRVHRVKKLTKMSEKVANGILSGVIKVSGFFTSSVVNSKVGKKFFSLLPGEIVLASLDGFSKVCDAVEVAGRNVLSTSSVVTTGLVSQRYGDQAGHVTNEGLDAAGHAFGAAWAVFKIRKALNPKSVIKPSTLAKAAVQANSSQSKSKSK